TVMYACLCEETVHAVPSDSGTCCVARIGPVALARLPRTQTGPSPMLSVAEAKPRLVPAIGSRNGAPAERSGSSSRGPTWGVPESLVLTGNGSPGVSAFAVIFPDRVK